MEVHTIVFEQIDSTNDWAKEHAKELDPEKLTCILADVQTKGRGRYDRSWVSKKGNLHMTLAFFLPKNSPKLKNLGQIFIYSSAKVLQQEVELEIKWPNDLIINGKKLAGILVETATQEEKTLVILGVGLNVNASVETNQETTSLSELTKKTWDLKILQERIVARFQKDLQKDFFAIRKDFESLLAYKNKQIVVYDREKKIHGVLDSLSDEGLLNVKLADGTIKQIASGEIQKLQLGNYH